MCLVASSIGLGSTPPWLTNIDWDIERAHLGTHLKTARVDLLNDLEAMALGAGVLGPDEVIELQRGVPRDGGNAAVIAAGTGLGQAYLHRVDGRLTGWHRRVGTATSAPGRILTSTSSRCCAIHPAGPDSDE